jgi:hypothetical protein
MLIATALAVLLSAPSGESAPVWVGRFSTPGAPPKPWRTMSRGGTRPTDYQVANVGGRIAVEAKVDRSMSLLARPVTIDLGKTPVLCWRWYVDGPVAKADMTKRNGDDYAARVYVGFRIPNSSLSGSTKFKLRIARALLGKDVPDAALVYVWDNKHPVGTARKSAFNDRTQLVVAETGSDRAGSWVYERANLSADFEAAFGKVPRTLTGVAVAADGDNTKSKGRAAFTDVHFVGSGQRCFT